MNQTILVVLYIFDSLKRTELYESLILKVNLTVFALFFFKLTKINSS